MPIPNIYIAIEYINETIVYDILGYTGSEPVGYSVVLNIIAT